MRLKRIGKSLLIHATAAALGLSIMVGAFGSFSAGENGLSGNITASAAEAPTSGSGSFKSGGHTYTYEYSTNSDRVETFVLKSVKVANRNVSIPSSVFVDGRYHTVTTLGNGFGEYITAESVSMPNTIKDVKNNAFFNANINTVYVSSSVRTIGDYFCSSANISNIVYTGNQLEKLGKGAFSGIFIRDVFGLKKNSKGAYIFGDWLIRYVGTDNVVKIKELGDGKTITKLGPDCFDTGSSATNLKREGVILDGVKIIESGAFKTNTNLNVVTFYGISSTLTRIDSTAFEGTKWLNSCKNNNFASLGAVLLYYHTNSNTIDLSDSRFSKIQTVAANAIYDCKNATILKLSTSIKQFEPGAFAVTNADRIDTVYVGGEQIVYRNNNQFLTKAIANSPSVFKYSAYVKQFTNQKIKNVLRCLGITYYGEQGRDGISTLSDSKKYEIVYKLHEYLATNFYYGTDYISTGRFIWNAFVDGQSGMVCQEYSELYATLLESAGVDAEVVSSVGRDENGNIFYNACHVWNIVNIGDKWYHIDVTWDSNYYHLGYDYPMYWFMVSDDFVKLGNMHNYWELYEDPNMMYNTRKTLPKCVSTHGDADGDNWRTEQDAKLIQRYFLNDKKAISSIKLGNSDLNFNGRIESSDANAIYKLITHYSADPFKGYGNHTAKRPS